MPDGWERLVSAVEAAIPLPAAEAEAALVDSLGDTPDLLAQARDILEGGRREDEFLNSDALGGGGEALSIPGFQVLDIIGHGGMGTVYRATQHRPERVVALKVLTTALSSEAERARFDYEVRALATLKHPGIAQVYATGVQRIGDGIFARDLPWFAMELVEEARPLTEYVRGANLDLEARLELFVDVCDAAHHGHQKGIVHRDLKPDNILVDGNGRPKIIDYGVACGLGQTDVMETLKTSASEIVGTLPYMSPERVSRESDGSDVRSDVYSLGVVLHELVAGALPIEVTAADLLTSMRRIVEEQPKRLSRIDRSIAPDLDAIALKALAKDPAGRYASADALAEDVRRFLTHRPIAARPPTIRHQLALFARRHRALVFASAAVFLIGIIATIISVGWALRSDAAEEQAQKERKDAVEERDRASQLFRALLAKNLETTLELAPRLHHMPDGAERAKDLVEQVLKDVKVLEQLGGEDPQLHVLTIETLLRLGDTQGHPDVPNMRDRKAAMATYERAEAAADKAVALYPRHTTIRLAAARAHLKLGQMYDFEARRLRMYRRSPAEMTPKRRVHLDKALEHLKAAPPLDVMEKSAIRVERDVHRAAGRLAVDTKDWQGVERHAAAIERMYQQGRLNSPVSGIRLLTNMYYKRGRHGDGAIAWERALPFYLRAINDGKFAPREDKFQLAQALGMAGEACWMSGDMHRALLHLEGSVSLLKELFAASKNDHRVFVHLNIQQLHLSSAYEAEALSRYYLPDRIRWFRQAQAALEGAFDDLGPSEADTRHRALMRKSLVRQIKRMKEYVRETEERVKQGV